MAPAHAHRTPTAPPHVFRYITDYFKHRDLSQIERYNEVARNKMHKAFKEVDHTLKVLSAALQRRAELPEQLRKYMHLKAKERAAAGTFDHMLRAAGVESGSDLERKLIEWWAVKALSLQFSIYFEKAFH